MNAPLYTTEILRLAASLSEPHKLEREDGRAEVRSPTCGSRLTLAVQLEADGRVAAVSQLVHACAFGQAAAALLERGAAGRNQDDVSRILGEFTDWLAGANQTPDWPDITALAPARSRKSRHGAILLPFRALLAAMESTR
jgi:NifU-like protein involved in Fe-S cluster formation